MTRFQSISVEQAAQLLRSGGVVAVPSETVYGLAANALDAVAVARIFQIKGRPSTNPLIVHCRDADHARSLATDWPVQAEQLARAFWPGPLTIVLPKVSVIPDITTASRPTVALRVPRHPMLQSLLSLLDFPLAAPSANRSNRISPTSARHVYDEFGSTVAILDGGACELGIESTVIDLSGRPRLLRPGSVSLDQLRAVIGPVEVFEGHVESNAAAMSPGQQATHYSPRCKAIRFTRDAVLTVPPRTCAIVIGSLPSSLANVGLLHYGILSSDPARAAEKLYSVMRYLDGLSPDLMLIELPPELEEWRGVRDRVTRATRATNTSTH